MDNIRSGFSRGKWAVMFFLALLVLLSSASGKDVVNSLVPTPQGDDAYTRMKWWNDATVKRVWGCDTCNPGDIACSLGAAKAEAYRKSCCATWGLDEDCCSLYPSNSTFIHCCNDPGAFCGYWNKSADYYGYEDRDDGKFQDNPLYKWHDNVWDTKLDYESGIPDELIAVNSTHSIQTNMSAWFIVESTWKGRPYWMHYQDPTPSHNAMDWQVWLMPCAKQDQQVQYWCRWTKCEKFSNTPCPCYPSNETFHEALCNSLNCGAAHNCFSWNGQCYDGPPTPYPCNDGTDASGHPFCNNCAAWSTGQPYSGNEGSTAAGGACCWHCDPSDPNGGSPKPVEPLGFCGWGGVSIEKDFYEAGFLNYTDYPLRRPDGSDINDDLPVEKNYFDNSPAAAIWPGQQPHVLPDYDLVMDRYWKRNATDTEFYGSRPGYCAYETTGVLNSCKETISNENEGTPSPGNSRDTENRPISKQHDPCRVCRINFDGIYRIMIPPASATCQYPDCTIPDTAHNILNPVCPDECFSYDLRYYREVNVDSLWANIFKIAPEVNYMFMDYPMENKYPDDNGKCVKQRPGNHPCDGASSEGSKLIGEACINDSKCIVGTSCVGTFDDIEVDKHCCPLGGYYWSGNGEACCRDKMTHSCLQIIYDCPEDKRKPLASNHWDEFTQDYVGWLMENFYGIKPATEYKIGMGEKGCSTDEDCATYISPLNFNDKLVLHCSMATDTGAAGGAFTKEPQANHCCTADMEWDATYDCCMPKEDAVHIVKMNDHQPVMRTPDDASGSADYFDTGYCEEKVLESDGAKKCSREEGPCRLKDRQGDDIPMDDSGTVKWECDTGLNCTQSWYSTDPWETACCLPDEKWTGRNCEPLNKTSLNPYYARWTRGGAGGDIGGGSITIYSAAGQMIPNGSEAAGWGHKGTEQPTRDMRYYSTEWPKGWWRDSCSYGAEDCGSADGAWPYRVPPSPIWYEVRNLGNDYMWGAPMGVCNGKFFGIDATVEPFDHDIWCVSPYGTQVECDNKDCNCGRAMWGIGDKKDGVKNWDPSGGCIAGTCNEQHGTACKRGIWDDPDMADPATQHKCNCAGPGHGGFNIDGNNCNGNFKTNPMTANPPGIQNTTIVPPTNMSGGVIDADLIIPEVCGRIERKEVATDNGYYPNPWGPSPYSWFDYQLYEYDQDHNLITQQHYKGKGTKSQANLLPHPPAPYTLLRDDKLEVTLSPNTRYIKVEMNYTVENEIKRVAYVKTCMWRGCSRLEEVLISFHEKWRHFHCGQVLPADAADDVNYTSGSTNPQHSISFSNGCYTETRTVTGGCCCTRANWVDTPTSSCGASFIHDHWCGGCGSDTCYTGVDADGNCLGAHTEKGYDEHYDDCDCKYACWGCWHYNVADWTTGIIDYPVTRPALTGPGAGSPSGKEELVYEEINDTSRVNAVPYGDDGTLRVENDQTTGTSEVKTEVTGRLVYGHEELTYSSGYLTMLSYDDESERTNKPHIDMLSGFQLAIPDITVLSFNSEQYPESHDLTELASTFAHDYVVVPDDLRYILRLNSMCYVRDDTSGTPTADLKNKTAVNPLYIRWVFNPVKKFYQYFDLFSATGTKYNWATPIVLADRSNIYCQNNFDERSPVIGLYRNFHEDEPHYYDYESFQMNPQNVEKSLKYYAYDPKTLGNVFQHEIKKPIQNIYVRQALPCDQEPYLSMAGSCPEMCSDIAEPDGACDCKYKAGLEGQFPLGKDACKGVTDWTKSDTFPCEGGPSKYKSYCSNGMFEAYWLDKQEIWYRDDGSGGCEFSETAGGPLKTCHPKELPPKSYTLVFEPSSTLDKTDWATAELTIYNTLRGIVVQQPFGTDPCTSQHVHKADGGMTLDVDTPPPTKYKLQGSVSGDSASLTITPEPVCGATSDCEQVYVKFIYPYAKYSGFYDVGGSVNIANVQRGNNIKAQISCFDDSGFFQTVPYISTVEVPYSTDTCDYLMDHIWVLLIAYAMIMSYRYFSGRAGDIKDMIDEYYGKK